MPRGDRAGATACQGGAQGPPKAPPARCSAFTIASSLSLPGSSSIGVVPGKKVQDQEASGCHLWGEVWDLQHCGEHVSLPGQGLGSRHCPFGGLPMHRRKHKPQIPFSLLFSLIPQMCSEQDNRDDGKNSCIFRTWICPKYILRHETMLLPLRKRNHSKLMGCSGSRPVWRGGKCKVSVQEGAVIPAAHGGAGVVGKSGNESVRISGQSI